MAIFRIPPPQYLGGRQPNAPATFAPPVAAGSSAAPGVGSIVFTGFAPTVTAAAVHILAGQAQQPAYTGILAAWQLPPGLTLLRPAALAQGAIPPAFAPNAGTILFTGVAPTVTAGTTVAPGVGSVVLTGISPAVTFGNTLAPSVGSAVFAGASPTVAVGQYGFLPPLWQQTVLAAWQPADPSPTLPRYGVPQTPAGVNPSGGSIVFTGAAPTVAYGTVLAPAVASIAFTGFAPTVTAGQYGFLPPLWQSAVLSAWVPPDPLPILPRRITPQAPASAAPGVGSATFTGFAPTVTAGNTVAPPVGSAVFTGFAPTVTALAAYLPGGYWVTQPEYTAILAAWQLPPGLTLLRTAALAQGAVQPAVGPSAGAILFTGFPPTVDAGKKASPPTWASTVLAAWVPPDPLPTLPRHIIPQAPASAAPGVGSAVFTGFAPTVTYGATVAPAAGSVVLTGAAPTVVAVQLALAAQSPLATILASWQTPDPLPTLPRRITPQAPTAAAPGVGSAVFTGQAPTVTAGNTAAPGVGSVVVTGTAPTVAAGNTAAPGVGSVVFSGFAPTVTTSGAPLVPPAGSVVFTGAAPTVVTGNTVAPAVGSIVLTGAAPSLVVGQYGFLRPVWLSAVLTSWQSPDPLPTLPRRNTPQAPTSAAPGVGSAVLTGQAPTVTYAAVAVPGAGSVVITGFAPAAATGGTLAPAAGAITIGGLAPTVTTGATVSPAVGSLAFAGVAPTVAAGATAAPATGSIVFGGHPVSISVPPPWGSPAAITRMQTAVVAWQPPDPQPQRFVPTQALSKTQSPVPGREFLLPADIRTVIDTADVRAVLLPPDTRTVIQQPDIRTILLPADVRAVIARPDEELSMPEAPPQWSPAASSDVDLYFLSLSRWLPTGDTVNTPSVTVVPIAGDLNPIVVGSVSVDTGPRSVVIPPGVVYLDPGPRLLAILSGGTTGKTYTTILTWHDAQGRTINRQVLLSIQW